MTRKATVRSRSETLERIFTEKEKSGLRLRVFKNLNLDCVDFRGAKLSVCKFEDVSLAGSDFTGADLRGAAFLRCDLRRVRFANALFANNRFDGSWLTAAVGLTPRQREYIEKRGGRFLRAVEPPPRQGKKQGKGR